MKTIYISGPITDLSTGRPREGWQKDFLDAEAKLRRMGFNVINPVDIAREVEDMKRIQHEFVPTPIDAHGNPLPPTRADYIMACLYRMKLNHTFDRLHGVYVIGSKEYSRYCNVPLGVPAILCSDGVQMELHMARVLGLPIFAEFYDDNEIDVKLQPVRGGHCLLDNGDFGD
jgi:hypothetical protein